MKITIELTDEELIALRASINAQLAAREKAARSGTRPESTLALPGGEVSVSFEKVKHQPGYRKRMVETKAKAIEAMLRGEPVPRIAKAVGVSEFSIYQWRSQAMKDGMEFPTPPRVHKENPNYQDAIKDMSLGMLREDASKKYGVSFATLTIWRRKAKAGGVVFPELRWSQKRRESVEVKAKAKAKRKKIETKVDVRSALYNVAYFDRGRLGRNMLESKPLAECHDFIKTMLNVQRLWPVGTGPEGALETFMNPEKGMKDGYCVIKAE